MIRLSYKKLRSDVIDIHSQKHLTAFMILGYLDLAFHLFSI